MRATNLERACLDATRQDRENGPYAESVLDEEAFWEQLDDWVLVQVAESRRHEPTMDWDEFLESIGENDDDDD